MWSYVSRTTENCTRTLAPNKSVRSAFISSYDTFLIKGKNDGPVVSLFKVVSLVVSSSNMLLATEILPESSSTTNQRLASEVNIKRFLI